MAEIKAMGIDIGGTKILGVVCDPTTGDVSSEFRLPTPKAPADLPTRITEVAQHLLDSHGDVETIGVGLPGLVDRSGVLRYGPNVPGVLALNMADLLEKEVELPVSGHNDGTCTAIAEHRLGAAKGYSDAVVVAQGTGIGGGLIINNQPVLGANGFAGEPGHMQSVYGGKICACGIAGCWEAYASGTGLGRIAQEYLASNRDSRIVELVDGVLDHVRGEHVSAALDQSDEAAIEIMRQFVVWTTAGIASLISLLDPGVVVLGGGLSSLSQGFVGEVEDGLPRFLMGAAYRPATPVVSARLGSESGAIGAAISGHDHASNVRR